jgi:co-chaperonin GroES (HSP10)
MTYRTPSLAECRPEIEPTEYAVLIAMAQKEERTAGGIILTQDAQDQDTWRASIGRLVAVSPLAFTYDKWPDGAPKPQVGDLVFVGSFPGAEVEGRDGRKYRLCDDKSIKAVILERAEAQELSHAA